MSQDTSETKQEEGFKWADFLQSQPPGRLCAIDSLWERTDEGRARLLLPELRLYCKSTECDDVCFFDPQADGSNFYSKPLNLFLPYACRHCKTTTKFYAVRVLQEPEGAGRAVKFGEVPAFGPHIPTKMFSLLEDDQEAFHKGRRCESMSMGIGAFAYYRQVVENQKNRVVGEIIKASKRLCVDSAIIEKMEAAIQETQFSKAMVTMKDALPEVAHSTKRWTARAG